MEAVLAAIGLSFAWGIRRGASSCLVLCVPAIIPALIEGEGGWKKGIKIALLFNTPRIILLTALGLAIGGGGFLLATSLGALSTGGVIWGIGYGIIGILMLAYGIYTFAKVTDRLEDIAEGKECKAGIVHPIISRLGKFAPKDRTGLLLWGCLVSVACIGETVIAMEGVMVGIVSAGAGTDPLSSALIGGLIFFIFGVATAIPTVIIALFSSTLADREKRIERLLQFERLAGILMITFGALVLISSLFLLL